MPNYPVYLNGFGYKQYYDYAPGTSMAAPQVTATAALMLSVNPDLTPAQIRTRLQNSADKVPGMEGNNHTEKYGYGRLNAHQALVEALCLPVYFENKIVLFDKTISRCHTVVRNVIVSGGYGWWLTPATLTINSKIAKIEDNVTVQDGAKLIINADNVRIDKNFEAELGSELVVNPN